MNTNVPVISKRELLEFGVGQGQPIGTVCKPDFWPPWKPLPCLGIKGWQLYKGYYPYHTITHIGRHLTDGNVFEVTTPNAKIGPLDKFIGDKKAFVFQRVVDGQDFHFDSDAVAHMWDAAEKLIQPPWSNYDEIQLLLHIPVDLYGVPLDEWTAFDLFKKQRVCSSGDSYVEEYARRKVTQENSMTGAPTVGDPMFGDAAKQGVVEEAWPRAFEFAPGRYIHTDRVKPADYPYWGSYRILYEVRP